MNWIYLSPHLDDVVLSCGGLISQQVQAGSPVSVWTVCAGDPPPVPLSPYAQSLHARWESGPAAVEHRRREDREACRILGAVPVHLPVPDCIYRRAPVTGEALYTSDASLFGVFQPADDDLVFELADLFRRKLADPALAAGTTRLVCPLGLGNHVDHRLTRRAAEALQIPLWYYADYPYASFFPGAVEELAAQSGLVPAVFPLSQAALEAWMISVEAHGSQISTFWPDIPSMRAALADFAAKMGGGCLWHME